MKKKPKIFYLRNRISRGENIFLKITKQILADLFSVNKQTIQRWIRESKLNPYSMQDIIEKYNNKHLLDNRKKNNKINTIDTNVSRETL